LSPALQWKALSDNRSQKTAEHERFAHSLSIQVFFADPHSPWQRRTKENANDLPRQYLSKRTDLSGSTPRELNTIV
jgi:IS30 family transposase